MSYGDLQQAARKGSLGAKHCRARSGACGGGDAFTWMSQFFARCPNCQVDFIALHICERCHAPSPFPAAVCNGPQASCHLICSPDCLCLPADACTAASVEVRTHYTFVRRSCDLALCACFAYLRHAAAQCVASDRTQKLASWILFGHYIKSHFLTGAMFRLQTYVEQMIAKFGRPVWVTEFACPSNAISSQLRWAFANLQHNKRSCWSSGSHDCLQLCLANKQNPAHPT